MAIIALGIIISYLFGSLAFAIIFASFFNRQDPRTFGSGNPGATNMMRQPKGMGLAVATLLADTFKAIIPIYIALAYDMPLLEVSLMGLAVFIGHCYPCFFGFKGGKGVATAFGVLIGISPWFALYTLCIFMMVLIAFRMVSLASITSAFICMLAWHYVYAQDSWPIILMVTLLIYRHRSNIIRILKGCESRI